MAKKLFVSAMLLVASCFTAWGQTRYNVTYTDSGSSQNMATITKSENGTMTLADAISEVNQKQINNADIKKVVIKGDITSDVSALSNITCTTIDLSQATLTSFKNDHVKYVVLPDGWTKEQVNTTAKAIGSSLESAASAMTMIVNVPVRHYYDGDTEITDTTRVKTNSEGNYYYYVKTLSKEAPVTLVKGYPRTKYAYTYGNVEYEIDESKVKKANDGTATITSFSIPLTKENAWFKQDGTTKLESWAVQDGKYWENGQQIPAIQKPVYTYTYNYNPKTYEGEVTTNSDGTYSGTITLDSEQTVKITTLYRYNYEDFDDNTKYFDQENEYTAETKTIYKYKDTELTSKSINENVNKGVSLTAYIKKPGTLVYTILNMHQLGSDYQSWILNNSDCWSDYWYVDHKNSNYVYKYSAENVKNITISGYPNAIDLNKDHKDIITDEGHLTLGKGNNKYALPGCNPDTLDLSDAIFGEGTNYHPEDMTISKLFPKLKSVLLPTHESQTEIPAECFNLMENLTELMIPSHYRVIGERAFLNVHKLTHIYVKDIKADKKYDHGNYTITLPESLEEIRSEGTVDNPTFFGDGMKKVTDIYVMAENAPKCGKNAFSNHLTCGYGGFVGSWAHPIQRSNYDKSGEVIAVLHYPAKSKYNGEDKNFTDITRVYTLYDETGMVDGNGNLKVWPRHEELCRSYNQAIEGYIWNDWKDYKYNGNNEYQYTLEDNTTRYKQDDYQGWHEFVLSETYIPKPFEPQEYYNKFDQYDWYTICIPYNITKSMLLQAFGVSTDSKDNNTVKLIDGKGYINAATVTGADAGNGWIYPDVRSLIQVKRSYNNKKVTLCLSEKLFTPNRCQEITIPENGQGYDYTPLTDDDPIIIKAGMPYLIRPYVPADAHIKNIGAYLCAYVSQLKDVKPVLFKAIEGNDKKYAVPYEKGVETHALKLDESTENNRVYVMKDANTPCKYNFVGSYVDRLIPQYGYYLGKEKSTGKHKFFRTSKTTTKWNRYSSIITGMSTPDYVNEGDESEEGIQNIVLKFHSTDDLVVLEDEKPKTGNTSAKRLGIAFDDSGVNDLPTSIDEIDVDIALPEDSRIYTVNGTRVAADRLKKGIYIQNGKKIVVK